MHTKEVSKEKYSALETVSVFVTGIFCKLYLRSIEKLLFRFSAATNENITRT